MTDIIKWGRSDDGFIESKCGNYAIFPEFWGCVSAQNYKLQVKKEGVFVTLPVIFNTQKEAKEAI